MHSFKKYIFVSTHHFLVSRNDAHCRLPISSKFLELLVTHLLLKIHIISFSSTIKHLWVVNSSNQLTQLKQLTAKSLSSGYNPRVLNNIGIGSHDFRSLLSSIRPICHHVIMFRQEVINESKTKSFNTHSVLQIIQYIYNSHCFSCCIKQASRQRNVGLKNYPISLSLVHSYTRLSFFQ